MRVVILGAKGLPGVEGAGGVETGVLETASRLCARGCTVVVYERGQRPAERREGPIIVRTSRFWNTHSFAGLSHCLFSVVDALVRLPRADVFHVHGTMQGICCWPLRLTGARVIYHLHGREWRARKWTLAVRGLMFLSCLLGVLASHSTIGVCHTSLAVLGRWLPFCRRKMSLLRNGLPEPCPPIAATGRCRIPEIGEDVPFFLYVGRLVPQKRIDVLLQAYAAVRTQTRLVIVGPTSHADKYVNRLRRMAVRDERVIWLGQRPQSELALLYRRCVALILPSEAEGCSNVLLEGLAAGCCIVASDIEENAAVLGEAALCFRTNDPAALSAILARLDHDIALRTRYSNKARERRQSLAGWDRVTESLYLLYGQSAVVDADVPGISTPQSNNAIDRLSLRHGEVATKSG